MLPIPLQDVHLALPSANAILKTPSATPLSINLFHVLREYFVSVVRICRTLSQVLLGSYLAALGFDIFEDRFS